MKFRKFEVGEKINEIRGVGMSMKDRKWLPLLVATLLIAVYGIIFLRQTTTVIFYLENIPPVFESKSIEIQSNKTTLIKEDLLKKAAPYIFLRPIKVHRGIQNFSLIVNNKFSHEENMFFYSGTHYVKVGLDIENGELRLFNGRSIVPYQ